MTTELTYIQMAIIEAARTSVDNSSEFQAWEVQYNTLRDKLRKANPELADELFTVTYGGLALRGEAMFLEGWRLRGNPDQLFRLPDPE